VEVETTHRHEENLPFGAQRVARGDQARHQPQLAGQAVVGGWEGVEGRIGRGEGVERVGDGALGGEGAGGNEVVFVLQRMAARLQGELQHRRAHLRRAVDVVVQRVDAHRAVAADLVAQRLIAGEKHGVARHRNAGQHVVGVVAAAGKIADVTAPAGGGALGSGRHPHRLLVVVGEQLGRQRHAACVVLLARGGHHQRPHVELHRGTAGVEQPGQSGHGRMQRVLHTAGQGHGRVQGGGGQAGARQRDAGPDGVVLPVGGRVVVDHRVGMVVATEEEHADQRLVVGGVEGRGLAEGGEIHHGGQGGAGEGELSGAAQEGAAVVAIGLQQVHGGPHFCTRYSGQPITIRMAAHTRRLRASRLLLAVRGVASSALTMRSCVASEIWPAASTTLR